MTFFLISILINFVYRVKHSLCHDHFYPSFSEHQKILGKWKIISRTLNEIIIWLEKNILIYVAMIPKLLIFIAIVWYNKLLDLFIFNNKNVKNIVY